MNNYFSTIAFAALCALSMTSAVAQSNAMEPARLAPEELKWTLSPTGTHRAVLAGDEKKAGMYAYRARFPANFRNQPHFHPDDRMATVLSGTLLVGFGEKFDEARMKALTAGGVWTEPAGQPHYVWAKDGEVVIQIIGVGPSAMTLVDPKR